MSEENGREKQVLKLKSLLIGVIAVLALLAVIFVPVVSATNRFDSRVTIHISPGGIAAYFYGLAKSERAACVKHRVMKVLVSPNGKSDFTTYATGIRTNADGTWTVYEGPGQIHNGYYKAIARSANIGSGVCKRAESGVFFVD